MCVAAAGCCCLRARDDAPPTRSPLPQVPICYSITPFVLYRPFEFLRTYVNHERIPVKLVGCGRDKDYDHDGISHWAEDDERVLAALPNIRIFKPADDEELARIWRDFLLSPEPAYLNLRRF